MRIVLQVKLIPPPRINNINTEEGRSWRNEGLSGGSLNVDREIHLKGDQFFDEVVIENNGHLTVDNSLTIGQGGIWNSIVTGSGSINAKSITSNTGTLRVHLDDNQLGSAHLKITSSIRNSNFRVGLYVTGRMPLNGLSVLEITGSESNTFTGESVFDGAAVMLTKGKGATALSGIIKASNSTTLGIIRSNQIADTSTVLLNSNAMLYFASIRGEDNIVEKFHNLVVDGTGILDFHASLRIHYNRTLYLDDLLVGESSELIVKSWGDGRDRLLVRKDSRNLEASLGRIDLVGYDKSTISRREWKDDDNYWEIFADVPEPATYGAIFCTLGLGLWIYRKAGIPTKHKEVYL